jgi:cell wall-associated NlpC family hydrolase
MRHPPFLAFAGALLSAAALTTAPGALAGPKASSNWAATEIAKVTSAGVLGPPGTSFLGQGPLTQQALAAALAATDKLQHPPPPPAPPPAPAPSPPPVPVAPPPPPPVQLLSTIPADATIAVVVPWEITVPGQTVDSVAFAIDGAQLDLESQAPFVFARTRGGLATAALADGVHQFAVAAHVVDRGTYVAVWNVTVANTATPLAAPLPTSPSPVPITHAPPPPRAPLPAPAPAPVVQVPLPQPAPAPEPAGPTAVLYRAVSPSSPVTIKQLDGALVAYLGLGPAAARIQDTLAGAGLAPPPHTGTEVVARLLELRFDHPAAADGLELRPNDSATRAEAAYSFSRLLELGPDDSQRVQSIADAFTLPGYTPWQARLLKTAVHYVGYPYVWGGTSPTAEAPFGVSSRGGFDCSGFVWRVFKLTSYPGERDLAGVLRGRTTYVMSGEVPRSERIGASHLVPGDVMFFGVGPHSEPGQVDHTAIYAGNGWLIQSSGQGVTLAPFDGWYRQSFAWARRPLHEAGLG